MNSTPMSREIWPTKTDCPWVRSGVSQSRRWLRWLAAAVGVGAAAGQRRKRGAQALDVEVAEGVGGPELREIDALDGELGASDGDGEAEAQLVAAAEHPDGDELQAGLAVGEDVAGGGRAGGDAAGHPAGGKEGVARGVGLGVEPFVEAPGGFAGREVIGVGDDGEVDRDVGRGVGDLDPDRLDTAGVERDAEDPGVGRGVGDSDTHGDGALALLANLGAGRRVRRGERAAARIRRTPAAASRRARPAARLTAPASP